MTIPEISKAIQGLEEALQKTNAAYTSLRSDLAELRKQIGVEPEPKCAEAISETQMERLQRR